MFIFFKLSTSNTLLNPTNFLFLRIYVFELCECSFQNNTIKNEYKMSKPGSNTIDIGEFSESKHDSSIDLNGLGVITKIEKRFVVSDIRKSFKYPEYLLTYDEDTLEVKKVPTQVLLQHFEEQKNKFLHQTN